MNSQSELACIQIGPHAIAQGEIVATDGTTATIRDGNRTLTGHLVPTFRR